MEIIKSKEGYHSKFSYKIIYTGTHNSNTDLKTAYVHFKDLARGRQRTNITGSLLARV